MGHVEEVRHVVPGDDQQVPWSQGVVVMAREGKVVFHDHILGGTKYADGESFLSSGGFRRRGVVFHEFQKQFTYPGFGQD